ncbi:hypothetical protein ACJJTC_004057 [Scirpophaga incertulas]
MAFKPTESKFKIQCDWFINTNNIINNKSQTSGVISARLRKIEERYKLLSEAYEALLNCLTDETAISSYDIQFKNAEEIYYQLESISSAYPNLDGTHQPTESSQNARLPTINLSVYDGDIFDVSGNITLRHVVVRQHVFRCGNIGHNKLICTMHIVRSESPTTTRQAFVAQSGERSSNSANRFVVSPKQRRSDTGHGDSSNRAHLIHDSNALRYQRRIDNHTKGDFILTDSAQSHSGPQDRRSASPRGLRYQNTTSQ